jgi:alginate O-acetyltransferase complex protein AlgI
MLEIATLAPRARHLLGLLLTEWIAVGVVVAAASWALGGWLGSPRARERALLATSLVVLAWFASVPVAGAWVAYALAFHVAVERVRPRSVAVILVGALLAAQIVLPILFIAPLGERGVHVREFTAFATNMAILRFHAYAWDRLRGTGERLPLCRFLLAMFFFPTFVNGPVETAGRPASDWAPSSGGDRPSAAGGLARVVLGAGKLALAGLAFAPGWIGATADGDPASLWVRGALLYVWFYLSFSAWTDVAVGIAAIAGRRVPENFRRPWAALDPADFWRRWHVSFGFWLRDYVYVPLGGNRRHRGANVLVTFLVSAAWHIWGSLKLLGFGYFPVHAWGGYLLWGGLNAAGVLVTRPLDRAMPVTGPVSRTVRTVGTFLFASFCWIPFFLPPGVPLASGLGMLRRMLWPG